jgi:hypothetical protein
VDDTLRICLRTKPQRSQFSDGLWENRILWLQHGIQFTNSEWILRTVAAANCSIGERQKTHETFLTFYQRNSMILAPEFLLVKNINCTQRMKLCITITLKSSIFWHVTQCSLLKINPFGFIF